MPLILCIIALAALKFFEIWHFTKLSWWWIIGLMVLGLLWFEVVEPFFGLDKRRSHNEYEEIRKKRINKIFKR